MKLRYELISTMVALALMVSAAFAKDQTLTVAVFDFESKDELVRDLGPKISSLINSALSADASLVTVERAELEKILGEHELGLSGAISTDTAAKVGHLTGAKVLVTGRIFNVEKERVIVAKIIGTETSRVYGELSKAPSNSSITDQAQELGRKVAATIKAKGDTLIAKGETAEERVTRLARTFEGRKLPAVSVQIPETHFGQPVRDPAVETEILRILQRCGFKIVDSKSKEKPDIEIVGEAFSAFGLRKGNLVSCKARIEVKVHNMQTRELLVADRQTSFGIDVAEQTAAKTALQDGALQLAERLLPRLVP